MKLYIAIPSNRDWKVGFGASLCGLVKRLALDNIDFDINCMMGVSLLPKGRQMAMDHAIENKYTHLLFLDDDMAFKSDLFSCLYKNLNENVQIVAANYVSKNPLASNTLAYDMDGKPIKSLKKQGIQEVSCVGFGAFLIDLSAMHYVQRPWFEVIWSDEKQDLIGEDFYFCYNVRAHGVKIYIDNSVKIAHIGDFNYIER